MKYKIFYEVRKHFRDNDGCHYYKTLKVSNSEQECFDFRATLPKDTKKIQYKVAGYYKSKIDFSEKSTRKAVELNQRIIMNQS